MIVVFAAVLGGFKMAGGPLAVLIQPNELVVIGGAAVGSLVISAPGRVGKRLLHAIKQAFSSHQPKPEDYLDLLVVLSRLLLISRRDGILTLEAHTSDPANSSLFRQHPNLLKRAHALDFMVEGIKQMVDGCPIEDLNAMMEADLEIQHAEEHQTIGLLRTTGDALPGLGIVAAVLGIVVTMGHLDGGPEEIGHHVAAALVGTFLGILLCYGVIGPLATSLEVQAAAEARYLQCIREGLVAAGRGANPATAVEFARRAVFPDERPTAEQVQAAVQALKDAK